METVFIEGMHPDGRGNHGKFLVGRFTPEEWSRRSEVDGLSLLGARGWDPHHVVVMDIQTGEGAVFAPHGFAQADLEKRKIWTCPLFAPFLTWLYAQDLSDLSKLPKLVEFPDAEFAFHGYRRDGDITAMLTGLAASKYTAGAARQMIHAVAWLLHEWRSDEEVADRLALIAAELLPKNRARAKEPARKKPTRRKSGAERPRRRVAR